jgi:hypothetical protein
MAGHPDHYSGVLATVGLSVLQEQAILLSETLDADGAPAQASLIRQAFLDLERELKFIAREIATRAEGYIRQAEVDSRVRGDTAGGGGARLQDFIGASAPLPGVPGSVGVNDEQMLEQSPVFWWWTNEEGYSGFIGREIRGFFQPGSSSPSPSRFREHPLFRPGGSGKGVIHNPIPARRFVERGYEQAADEWHAQIRAAKSSFLRTCEAAVAAAPPPRRPGAPGGRRRPRRP